MTDPSNVTVRSNTDPSSTTSDDVEDLVAEGLVEEVSIDGMCGVY